MCGQTTYLDLQHVSMKGCFVKGKHRFIHASETHPRIRTRPAAMALLLAIHLVPTLACPSTCWGHTCDHWVETSGKTCAELRENGCECSGCACGDATSPAPSPGQPTPTPPGSRRKILCLHGGGGTGPGFEIGFALSALAAEFDLVFPTAPQSGLWIRDPPGGKDVPTEDEDWASVAVAHLNEIVQSQGPFYAILGYSQGAAFVPVYLAQVPSGTFQLAALFCGYLPTTHNGLVRRINARAPFDGIASLHFMATNDPIITTGMSDEAAAKFSSPVVLVSPTAGHALPSSNDPTYPSVLAFFLSSPLLPRPPPPSLPLPPPPSSLLFFKPPKPPAPPPLAPALCVDDSIVCPHANDGECDDGGDGSLYALCPYGRDCADCGARVAPPPPMAPPPLPALCPPDKQWIECGRVGRCNNDGRCAGRTQTHEVRCCSDTEIGGWSKRHASCPWAESDDGMGGCHHSKTFPEAEAICAAAGARLCTKDELTSDCTRGTGCGHDRDLIWSSGDTAPGSAGAEGEQDATPEEDGMEGEAPKAEEAGKEDEAAKPEGWSSSWG